MATRTPAVTYAPGGLGNGVLVVWSGLLNGDDGAPFLIGDFADFSAQFGGTFGAGGSIQMEGANDNTNFLLLTDPQGNNIVKTAAGLEVIEEAIRSVRPRVTAGDGTTNLTCTMWARRGR